MKVPWVNLLLLILLLVQAITGTFGFTNGRATSAWLLALHGIVAYGLVLLLFLKAAIIGDAWRRKKRWTGRRAGFVVVLILLGLTLLSGLLWTFQGPLYLGGFSLVSLHIYIAIPLMRFIRHVPGATGRRLFLGGLATALGGLALWAVVGRVKAAAGLAGAARRFTGSYETGSFTPDFPVVSWIADRPPPVDGATWRLRIEGAVERPLSLSLDELAALAQGEVVAALDCTGGWYSVQRWRGPACCPRRPASLSRPSPATGGASHWSRPSRRCWRWARPTSRAKPTARSATATARRRGWCCRGGGGWSG
jgi:hypothetical protein